MSPRVYVTSGFLPEREVLELAPEIERLGFDGMTFPEHLFLPASKPGEYPYSEDGQPPFRLDSPWPDQFVLIGAVGAVTTRLRLMTAVHVLPVRHPLLTAKAAATAALLSGGRLSLGVGAGWQRDEFDVLGSDFSRRGVLMDDAIAALRAAWGESPVEHHGPCFSFGPLTFEPTPPPIPIVVGGSANAAIRRAARLGDGYILPTQPLAGVPAQLQRVREALAEANRDESSFEIFVPCLGAPTEEILSILGPGVGNITVMPWPHPGKEDTPRERKVADLERWADESLPAIRAGAPA